jgi:hypothetical protein
MKTFTQNEPLTDAELDRLGDFLKNCKGGRAKLTADRNPGERKGRSKLYLPNPL